MDMAAHERPSITPDLPPASAPSAAAAAANPGPPPRRQDPLPRPPLGLLARLSSQFGSRGLTRRGPALDDAARRELLLHGTEGTAIILSVRSATRTAPAQSDSNRDSAPHRTAAAAEPSTPPGIRADRFSGPTDAAGGAGTQHDPAPGRDRTVIGSRPTASNSNDRDNPDNDNPDNEGGSAPAAHPNSTPESGPGERLGSIGRGERRADIRTRAEKRVDARVAAEQRAEARDADAAEPGLTFWVRIQLEDRHAYETRVRQRVSAADREWMQPGDIVCCRVDPGDHDRVVLYLPAPEETSRTNIAKILADGRRARATVLAATPVAADYTGRDDPVLRLDLELRAWDEPAPWRVRVVAPVPLSAMELIDLGRHLEVAFFTVDRGESVAVDWAASREA